MSNQELFKAVRAGDIDLTRRISREHPEIFNNNKSWIFDLSLRKSHDDICKWFITTNKSDIELMTDCCLDINSEFSNQMLKYIINFYDVIELKIPNFDQVIKDTIAGLSN